MTMDLDHSALVSDATYPCWEQSLRRLLNDPLLLAIDAGWATSGDLGFIAPVLSAVHAMLVDAGMGSPRAAGGTACVTVRSRDAAQQSRPLPTCARFFVAEVTGLYRDYAASANQAFVRLTLQLSALGLAAMERKLPIAAADIETRLAALARGPGTDVVTGQAIDAYLDLQLEFLGDLLKLMRLHRLEGPIERIQARRSLELAAEPPIALHPGVGEIMFTEQDDRRHIAFTVERYPCTAEVLDPRVVRIPPGKSNNRHVHAHETLFLFLSGSGEILVGETWVKVKDGDAVFSPRWAVHQTRNTGTEELVLLAVTDYYLTSQVYVGKYDKI